MGRKKEIIIEKASGEHEAFSASKLKRSLRRSGASAAVAENVLEKVEGQLETGMTTKTIYNLAYSMLRKTDRPTASRYDLKRAIMEFGPSGYPFEEFVGEILRAQGYEVEVGKLVQGKCVDHEVDVVATKGNEHFLVECKFHNRPGLKSNVKVPLYVKARFDDIVAAEKKSKEHFDSCWVVTNTKFTSEAVKYGTCAGMKVLGWSHPKNEGIEDMIDRLGLHPITCLTRLSKQHKRKLIHDGVVLCRDATKRNLRKIGLDDNKIARVMDECTGVCEAYKK